MGAPLGSVIVPLIAAVTSWATASNRVTKHTESSLPRPVDLKCSFIETSSRMDGKERRNPSPASLHPVLGKELYSSKYLLSRKKNHCISIFAESFDSRSIAVRDSSIAGCSARLTEQLRNCGHRGQIHQP